MRAFVREGDATTRLRWWRAGALTVLLGYGIFLAVYFTPVASGSDSSGYLNFAHLLLRGRLVDEARPVRGLEAQSPFATVPLGFLMDPETGRLVPTYPSGMPLQFAAAEFVFGRAAGMHVVGVGGALAAVGLCYAVGRELGLSRALSALSAGMLAWNPVFLFIALQPLSDVLATTWILAAVFALLRARRSTGWALFAGAAAAMAVLVRPTNLLVFPALLVLMPGWRQFGLFVAGGLPGAVWMAWYQNALYGGPWASGYGDIRDHFHWSNLIPTSAHYAEWIPRFVPIVWVLAIAGVARFWRAEWKTVVALALWAAPVAVFYLFYDVTKETWWCLRFILPAMPALILGGAMGAAGIRAVATGRGVQLWRLGAAVVAVWAAGLGWFWGQRLKVIEISNSELPYREMATWVAANVPRDAAVVCFFASGAVHHYTSCAVLRWDMIARPEFESFARTMDVNVQPVYAVLFHEEEREALNERMPGRWEKIHEASRGAVWRLVGAARIERD